jgi:hypothetical protein
MFEKIKKLFGSTATTNKPLYASNHPAAKEIAETEKLAASVLSIEEEDAIKTRGFNTGDYFTIKEILDSAISKCQDDPDLFYARASLHYFFLQGEDGMKDREHCLSLEPDHFDAKMKRDHFSTWEGVFEMTEFNESSTTVPPAILKGIEVGQQIQVVRDHLFGAIALFMPYSQDYMQGCNRIRWELRWVNTPFGKIAAHYLFLDNGKFQELFIPHLSSDEPKINENYWLLRRLSRESYLIIAFIDGSSVVRCERFLFPRKLAVDLNRMEKDLIKDGPAASMDVIQQAVQWYMQNSDESNLKY